jgi:hypothetical protein
VVRQRPRELARLLLLLAAVRPAGRAAADLHLFSVLSPHRRRWRRRAAVRAGVGSCWLWRLPEPWVEATEGEREKERVLRKRAMELAAKEKVEVGFSRGVYIFFFSRWKFGCFLFASSFC